MALNIDLFKYYSEALEKNNEMIRLHKAKDEQKIVRKRKIFLERYWYLYSIKEISSKNKITESNTKTILLRLRNQLRNYLKEGGLYE